MTETTQAPEPGHMVDFREGVQLLKNEYADKALPKLQRAFESDKDNPYYTSFLGVCLARAEKKWDEASVLCEKAIQLKRTEIQFHLNLIEVYALAGRRDQALLTLDYATKSLGKDARLRRLRGKLVKRRAPMIPFLDRNHFLNRALGKLRHRFSDPK